MRKGWRLDLPYVERRERLAAARAQRRIDWLKIEMDERLEQVKRDIDKRNAEAERQRYGPQV